MRSMGMVAIGAGFGVGVTVVVVAAGTCAVICASMMSSNSPPRLWPTPAGHAADVWKPLDEYQL